MANLDNTKIYGNLTVVQDSILNGRVTLNSVTEDTSVLPSLMVNSDGEIVYRNLGTNAFSSDSLYTTTEINNFFSGVTTLTGYNRSNWDSAYSYSQIGHLPLIGGTLTGDLIVGATNRGSDTVIRALSNDAHKSGFEAYGNNQGNGYLYVGQDINHGGGISYNGDSSPSFITGETSDYITFFRRTNGLNHEVFSYAHSSDDVIFNGNIFVFGGNSTNWNTAYGWGDHSTAGYLTSETDSQTLAFNSTNGSLSISNGNTVDLDDRYYTKSQVDIIDRTYITDSRGSVRLPNYYDDRYAQWDFQNISDTLAGGDSWHGILTVSKWDNWASIHRQEQLLFTGDDLKRRTATSETTWGSIKTIYDSGNSNLSTVDWTAKNFKMLSNGYLILDTNPGDSFNYIKHDLENSEGHGAGVLLYGADLGHHFINGEDGQYNGIFAGTGTFTGLVTATGFKTPTGTDTQFLKADGSIDSGTYLPTGFLSDLPYSASWNGNTGIATKNAIYDKIETLTPNGANTSLQFNNNGVLGGVGANNTYTIELGKPLLLEPWSSHTNATGTGVIGYGEFGRPEVISNGNGHSERNSFEGQYPNDFYSGGLSITTNSSFSWRYGGCGDIALSTSNVTLTITDVPDGASGTILVKQSSTASRTLTILNGQSLTQIVMGGNSWVNTELGSYTTITYKRFGTKLILVYGYEN